MKPILLTWYGDDLTGSTDVMEALALNGVPAVLFLDPPEPAVVAERFPHARAVGVAGLTRALPPEGIEAELERVLAALEQIPSELFHYKICSTFDSSPTCGSIGRVMETGRRLTGARLLPLLVGAPRLKRYVVFGNLFATVGEETFRLDRHPTMSRHPVTPMTEADLRRHLAEQTDLPVALVDLHALEDNGRAAEARLDELLAGGAAAGVLFDTLTPEHLATLGRLLWRRRRELGRFVVGSSGVQWALATAWRESGLAHAAKEAPRERPVERLLILSGSASPVTAAQIETSLNGGYTGIRLDLPALLHPENGAGAQARVLAEAEAAFARGPGLILYAALGPEDPALGQTREAAARFGLPSAGEAVASLQAALLAELTLRVKPPRICVAGGDTSGRAARALGIEALELAQPMAPGAPLCRVHARPSQPSRYTILLKGGQNGGPDFFESIRLARPTQA